MIKLCTVRMSEGFIIFVHFNIDYYGLLESDTCSYVCTYMWTSSLRYAHEHSHCSE